MPMAACDRAETKPKVKKTAPLKADPPRYRIYGYALIKLMKVAILAGGVGSRLSEETVIKPKPMVEIGGRPILWHIMMHYAQYGFNDFVLALGYKGEYIKKYFVDYCSLESNLTVDVGSGTVERHANDHPDWKVELIDTGVATLTGGRIKRLAP